MSKNSMLIIIGIAFLNCILMTFVTVYFAGIKKYGTPSEYQEKQIEMITARRDSLLALEGMEPLENVADSTFFGMSMYSNIIERTTEKERELQTIQASIDSLKNLFTALEQKEQTIDIKTEQLITGREMLQDETAVKLAKLYDSMKTQMAVPIFQVMDDTLAVKILSRMQERNASRLLGALADKDVNKATQLNKLLSMNEVAK